MADIHPTALVDPAARLGESVEIGPYCIIGPEVEIGDGSVLKSHVNVDGFTRIGPGCIIWPFASVGTQTQDLKYQGGKPGVSIGANTTLREYATVNAATADGDLTVIGDQCHIMAYAHVAHDCLVGDGVIMANAATLAGHVIIEDHAIIGGLTGVHQFVRVGRQCIIGGCSKVVKDVPPFMTADGHPLKVRGINKVGLVRKGVNESVQAQLKEAYKILYMRELPTGKAVELIRQETQPAHELQQLLEFIDRSERGITR